MENDTKDSRIGWLALEGGVRDRGMVLVQTASLTSSKHADTYEAIIVSAVKRRSCLDV